MSVKATAQRRVSNGIAGNVAGFKLRYLGTHELDNGHTKETEIIRFRKQVCGTKSVAICRKRPMLRQTKLIMLISVH